MEEVSQTRRKRPFSVYVIIVMLILQILGNSVDVIRVRLGLNPLILPNLDHHLYVTVLNSAVVIVVLGVCLGLFLLRRWAWTAAMILIGVSLIYNIIHYLGGGQPYISMLIDVISVFYLNQRNVQAAFEGRLARPEMIA